MVLWHSLDPKKRNRYDCQALGILQKRSLRALKHCIGLPESDSDPLQGFRAFFLDKFPSFVVHGLNFNESIPRIKSQWDILDKTLRHIYKAREERLIYADLTDDIRHIWERSQKRLERLQQFEASSGQDLFENLELSGENWTNIDAKEQHRYNERVKEYKRGFLKKVPHHNQCPQCDHVYAHFDDLALHHRSKHVFYCRVCLLTFKSYKACHSHTLHNHFYEKLPKCDLCSFRGRHPTMVLSHIVREHHHDLGLSNQEPLVSKYLRRQETFLDNLKTEAPKTPQVQDFSCQDCSTRFENGSQLKYHRTKMHSVPKPSSICRFCDKSFYTASNLRRHIRKLHSTDTSKSVIPRVPCSLCQETFVDNYRLKIHMRKHTGELPFTCGKCTFGFKTNSDLKVHGKTCLGVRFTCAKCRRVFHFKKQLREHELWSEKCGTMRNHIHVLGDHSLGGSESQPSRYMKEKPRIVRLNFSKNQSVVGVNCENLHDQSVFTKRKRKVPCGICERCERDVNCGQCGSCQAQATTNVCEERKCLSFIEQFDVVKAKQKQVAKDLGLNLYENCPDIGADLSLMNGDEEKIQLDVDDPLPKEFVLDEDELLEGPDFTLDGILAGDNASAMHHQPQNVVFYNPDHVKERILVINEEIIENDI
ncbi:zinc finger protein 1 homolog [Tigriopus californicus]|nr:zinc finger protein 1 homolog [Tigriopus californicus]